MRDVGIGHNGGPSMDAVRIYRWARAKAALPRPKPLVARMWLERAAEIGMAPAEYFAFRGAAGRDLAGVIFTATALAPGRGQWEARAARLSAMRGVRLGLLVRAPMPDDALPGLVFAQAPLPAANAPWQARRTALAGLVAAMGVVKGGVLLVSDGPQDLLTMQAGGLADLWPPQRFFGEADPLENPSRT